MAYKSVDIEVEAKDDIPSFRDALVFQTEQEYNAYLKLAPEEQEALRTARYANWKMFVDVQSNKEEVAPVLADVSEDKIN